MSQILNPNNGNGKNSITEIKGQTGGIATGPLVTFNAENAGGNFDENDDTLFLTFPTFITSPPDSQDSSLSLGTAYQNVLGYDVLLIIYLEVVNVTGGGIQCGISSNSTPIQQTIISTIPGTTELIVTIPVYIPKNYYVLISVDSGITAAILGQQTIPI